MDRWALQEQQREREHADALAAEYASCCEDAGTIQEAFGEQADLLWSVMCDETLDRAEKYDAIERAVKGYIRSVALHHLEAEAA